jgi:hypothetical protein
MKPLPHVYEVRLAGGPTGYATASGSNLPDQRTASPRDFDGPGDAGALSNCSWQQLKLVSSSHSGRSRQLPRSSLGRSNSRGRELSITPEV